MSMISEITKMQIIKIIILGRGKHERRKNTEN